MIPRDRLRHKSALHLVGIPEGAGPTTFRSRGLRVRRMVHDRKNVPRVRDPVALERRFRATTRETVRRIRKRRGGAAGEQGARPFAPPGF
jgi:hypothetical protein